MCLFDDISLKIFALNDNNDSNKRYLIIILVINTYVRFEGYWNTVEMKDD